jgi:hypothetical protein
MKLIQRPLGLKLAFGIFTDALLGPFPGISPGSTLKRAMHIYGLYIGGSIHPYTKMWEDIADFYQCLGSKELSNKSLSALLKKASVEGIAYNVEGAEDWYLSKGFRLEAGQDNRRIYLTATAEDQEAAAQRWVNHGWINYEERKQDKADASIKMARLGLTATAASGALGTISLLLGDL